MKNIEKIEEILNRGTEDIIDKKHLKEALLSKKKLNIKFGIDPTGPKIHLGRATALMKLRDFQELGHKITLIIGDFTALIGDASDKTAMRKPLSSKEIKDNMKNYLPQIGRIIDLKKVDVRYNSEWLDKLSIKDLTRICMNFTAQQMIQRRNFKERWEEGKEIGLHELLYPVFQGYDSVAIKADIEIGGFDQLFNLKTGRDLQRIFKQKPQNIMTLKMIYGLDGRKMSTSWGNVINILDDPKDIFGKIMSLKDELIYGYFEACTRIPLEKIKEIKKEIKNPKEVKKILGKEIVKQFYSEKEAEAAQREFEKIFEKKDLPTEIKEIKIKEKELNILDLLVLTGLSKSKGEAKRVVEQGGVKIVKKGVSRAEKDWKKIITIEEMVIQSGKRNFIKIKNL
ncbi:MAG TPA: tyrosine--tRNA ligase [Candidatus Pacearchaeota archaeon]|mgnify:CR=1 FL=1|nr:tyrosine--tRNA ligase [Candidatus Parcubacteria bacterium]HOC53685.1 tyrosine--tRNA ligase [Candidatus Pacearchaeota archaeon]HQM24517.1 tyrosine--tRNA ligase [Candidatus Pacearchaeota archaeon]